MVEVGARRVCELVQDVRFGDPAATPQQLFAAATGGPDSDGAPLVDLGLLRRADLTRPVGLLSVGQRRRVGLALVIGARPDLLLLDEPTNHLSLGLVGEVEEALRSSAGTVLVATHDRWLRRRWDGREVALVPAGDGVPERGHGSGRW